jgi:hypothetical protein
MNMTWRKGKKKGTTATKAGIFKKFKINPKYHHRHLCPGVFVQTNANHLRQQSGCAKAGYALPSCASTTDLWVQP